VGKAHPPTRRPGDGRHLGCAEDESSSRSLVGSAPPEQSGARARRRDERAELGSSKRTPRSGDDQASRHEVSGPIGPGQSFRREQSRRKRLSCTGDRARPLTRSHPAVPSREGGAPGPRALETRSRVREAGVTTDPAVVLVDRIDCRSRRAALGVEAPWVMSPRRSSASSRPLSEAGEGASEAGSRRRSLETGGGLRLRASGAGAFVDGRCPGPRARGRSLTRSASVEVRRDLQASAGRSRVQGCQRWDGLPASRKTMPWSGWRRSEGSHDRQPAKDRATSADAPRARHECVPLSCRSPVCAVKPTPARAIACLNRTRRRESIDSLVLVANRRLSEFRKGRIFLAPAGRKVRRGVDSAARQTHYAGRRGLHRVGRHGCAVSLT
jgi:hypothetical protein